MSSALTDYLSTIEASQKSFGTKLQWKLPQFNVKNEQLFENADRRAIYQEYKEALEHYIRMNTLLKEFRPVLNKENKTLYSQLEAALLSNARSSYFNALSKLDSLENKIDKKAVQSLQAKTNPINQFLDFLENLDQKSYSTKAVKDEVLSHYHKLIETSKKKKINIRNQTIVIRKTLKELQSTAKKFELATRKNQPDEIKKLSVKLNELKRLHSNLNKKLSKITGQESIEDVNRRQRISSAALLKLPQQQQIEMQMLAQDYNKLVGSINQSLVKKGIQFDTNLFKTTKIDLGTFEVNAVLVKNYMRRLKQIDNYALPIKEKVNHLQSARKVFQAELMTKRASQEIINVHGDKVKPKEIEIVSIPSSKRKPSM